MTFLRVLQTILLITILFSSISSVDAHQDNDDNNRGVFTPTVTEHLGDIIPLELTFFDEQNHALTFKELIDRPTLVLPVYYQCPNACPLQLADLSTALNTVVQQAGDDYRVLALSFDENDTPSAALKAKKNYTNSLNKSFPKSAWSFLTGSKENITAFTDAIGFSFKRTADSQFIHPAVLVCLAPGGKIIRYIYGPGFLPLDLSMAISEAAKGTPGISIKKLLTYCFSYNPESQRYVFNTFRILALTTLILLIFFYFAVLRKR